MSSVCPSNSTSPDLSSGAAPRPAPFATSGGVNAVHELAPRFGRTSNITRVLIGQLEQQQEGGDGTITTTTTDDATEDYLRGVLSSAIILFVLILTWMTVLLVFKCCCCGKRRVGVLAGHPVTLSGRRGGSDERGSPSSSPEPPEHTQGEEVSETEATDRIHNTTAQQTTTMNGDDEDSQRPEDLESTAAADDDDRKMRRMRRLRITALLAGLGVFTGSILMITKGLRHIEDGLDSSRAGLVDGRRLALEAADLIETYKTTETSLVEDVTTIVPRINTFCPNVRETICRLDAGGDLTEACDYTDIPYGDVLQAVDLPNIDANVVFDAVTTTGTISGRGLVRDDTGHWPRALQTGDSLDGIQRDLQDLAGDLQDYEQQVEEVEWPITLAKAFAIVVIILDGFLMVCLIRAWCAGNDGRRGSENPVLRVVKSWVLLPLFILAVVICWISSLVSAVGSITTSDLCYQSPDSRVLAYVESRDDLKTTLVYDFVTYYLKRCPADKEPFAFDEIVQDVSSVADTLGSFLGQVRGRIDEVEAICGSNPGDVVSAADTLIDQMCSVTGVVHRVRDFFACDNWYPLYDLVAHDAVCSDAAPGFLWLAVSQFITVVCAMVLLTVRAALYETQDNSSAATVEKTFQVNKEHENDSSDEYYYD